MASKADRVFLLSWKRVGLIVLAWILAVVLHNAVSAIFGIEEAVFFIIAIFVIPIYAIVSIVYTIIKRIRGG